MAITAASEGRGRAIRGRAGGSPPAPLKRASAPANAEAKPEAGAAEVAAAREAAQRCACVIAGFFRIDPAALFKSTRGAPAEAFPRQLLMAGLVSELGFSPLITGRAIGRDKATVEHACRIIEAIRGGLDASDLIDILGASGVQEFLGGFDGAEEFLEHAEPLIDRLFDAFVCVAVQGAAYTAELDRLKQERNP